MKYTKITRFFLINRAQTKLADLMYINSQTTAVSMIIFYKLIFINTILLIFSY